MSIVWKLNFILFRNPGVVSLSALQLQEFSVSASWKISVRWVSLIWKSLEVCWLDLSLGKMICYWCLPLWHRGTKRAAQWNQFIWSLALSKLRLPSFSTSKLLILLGIEPGVALMLGGPLNHSTIQPALWLLTMFGSQSVECSSLFTFHSPTHQQHTYQLFCLRPM